jgi:methyltransferase-like protein
MVQIDAQQVKLDAIQGIINMLESTVTTHQLQRDEAVTKAAILQATIDNVFSIIAGKVYGEPTNEVS